MAANRLCTAVNRRPQNFSGLRSRQGRFARCRPLYQIPVASNRRVVGCAKSPGHGGATGTASPAILRTRSAAHIIIARCRDRGANQRPAACAKSPFDAVPAASVSQGDFAHPTCSDLTGIRSRVPVSNGNGNKHRLASTGVGSGRAAGACRAFRDLDICHSAYVADPPLLFRRIAAMIPPERARWLVVANKQK